MEHLADHELEDCVLLLDEMYQIADSRSSGSKLNKLFTYFMVQTRKRGVDVYFCTHHLDHVDLRLRRAADIRNSCRCVESVCPKCRCRVCGGEGIVGGVKCQTCGGVGGTGYDHKTQQPCMNCLGYGKVGWIRLHVLDRRQRRRFTPEDIFANPYWAFFNSYDRIPMPAKVIANIDTSEVI